MQGSKTLHVSLINDGLFERGVRRLIVSPIEIRIDYYRFGYERRAVQDIRTAFRIIEIVGEDGFIPVDLAFYGFCIGIE